MTVILLLVSSRRRHTMWPRDWSPDVCSSDLIRCWPISARTRSTLCPITTSRRMNRWCCRRAFRSEERRVAKERKWQGGQGPEDIKMRDEKVEEEDATWTVGRGDAPI